MASDARSGHDGNCFEVRSPNVVARPSDPDVAPTARRRIREAGVLERAEGLWLHCTELPRRVAEAADAYADEKPTSGVFFCSWRLSACEMPEGLPTLMLELRCVRIEEDEEVVVEKDEEGFEDDSTKVPTEGVEEEGGMEKALAGTWRFCGEGGCSKEAGEREAQASEAEEGGEEEDGKCDAPGPGSSFLNSSSRCRVSACSIGPPTATPLPCVSRLAAACSIVSGGSV